MKVEEISNCLGPWIQADTWHTSHPTDTKQFNNALSAVINTVGFAWGYDEFKDAINNSLEKHHPEQVENEHMQQEVDRCASKAEVILTYLQDIQ